MPALDYANAIVSALGDWLSLLSFALSIYTAVTVTRVKRATVGRAMMPALIDSLKQSNSLIAKMMRDFEVNKDDFELELARCVVSLRAIKGSTKGEALRRATAVEVLAKNFDRKRWFQSDDDRGTVKRARGIYVEMTALIAELDRASNEQILGG